MLYWLVLSVFLYNNIKIKYRWYKEYKKGIISNLISTDGFLFRQFHIKLDTEFFVTNNINSTLKYYG